jgi:hypothetical protein
MSADMDKLKEKIAAAIEKVANSFTDGYCPTPYEMTSVSDCLEFSEAALTAIEAAGYRLMPKDQILRKMSKDEFSELMAGIRFRENADG